ncbi:DoxX family protein [Streptomyces sp. NBC_01803]|uniref:DoxX family protein n=1 Tax=Streptomyces sp. NBC_01803 TaxID=2975946 RepID=UPI002DD7B5D7|nr:DoxX family protein [Streptomyces sp. NBC_01803]WSA44320.1 DoxX family protein [Streptomyces sp. NBC_01803]
MAPLVALVAGFLAARLAGLLGFEALDAWQPSLRVGLALMFLFATAAHFHPKLRPEMIGMVPPRMPRPDVLVTITGVLEAAGAIGLLIPATTRAAAVCLILLLLGMFPANISAARRHVAQGDPIGPRSALQALFVILLALTLV